MKVRLVVKFTKHPVIHPANFVSHAVQPIHNQYSSSFFTNIQLDIETERLLRHKLTAEKDYISKNILESQLRERSPEKLVRDRSLQVAERRAVIKEQQEQYARYKTAVDLMQQHQKQQKQIDIVRLGCNRVISRYLINVIHLYKVMYEMKQRVRVVSSHQDL